jgi:hypothetical protein
MQLVQWVLALELVAMAMQVNWLRNRKKAGCVGMGLKTIALLVGTVCLLWGYFNKSRINVVLGITLLITGTLVL